MENNQLLLEVQAIIDNKISKGEDVIPEKEYILFLILFTSNSQTEMLKNLNIEPLAYFKSYEKNILFMTNKINEKFGEVGLDILRKNEIMGMFI